MTGTTNTSTVSDHLSIITSLDDNCSNWPTYTEHDELETWANPNIFGGPDYLVDLENAFTWMHDMQIVED